MRTCIYDNISPMRREFWCDRLMVASVSSEELRTDSGRWKSQRLGCDWIDYEPTRTSGDIRALPEGYHALCGTFIYARVLASLAMHDFIDAMLAPVRRFLGAA